MAHYLIFDIETRVDKELVKRVYDSEETLTLEQAYDKARDKILERSGGHSDFFPIPYHVPIAVATLQLDQSYRILSLGCLGKDRFSEPELISRFWQMFETCKTLVSFNGRGFDLPVLETQALRHGLTLPRYFGTRDARPTFRGNRFSDVYHFDVYDFLSNFGAVHRRGSLDVLTKLIGLPGKYFIAGEDIEYLNRQGRQKEINQYCITDVLQTFVLFLRVDLLRGQLDKVAYEEIVVAAREDLLTRANQAGPENFLHDFLGRWNKED